MKIIDEVLPNTLPPIISTNPRKKIDYDKVINSSLSFMYCYFYVSYIIHLYLLFIVIEQRESILVKVLWYMHRFGRYLYFQCKLRSLYCSRKMQLCINRKSFKIKSVDSNCISLNTYQYKFYLYIIVL